MPDLAPVDFMLLPKLKTVLKGMHFDDIQDIQHHATTELDNILFKKLKEASLDLYHCCEFCIVLNGD